ncbi:MAG: hypothetical protein ACK5RG_22370 [Cyclobacteriaceae bacterium]
MRLFLSLILCISLKIGYCQEKTPIHKIQSELQKKKNAVTDSLLSKAVNRSDSVIRINKKVVSLIEKFDYKLSVDSIKNLSDSTLDVNSLKKVSTLSLYIPSKVSISQYRMPDLKWSNSIFKSQSFELNHLVLDSSFLLLKRNRKVDNISPLKYSSMLESIPARNFAVGNFELNPTIGKIPEGVNSAGTVLREQINQGNAEITEKTVLTSSLPETSLPNELNIKQKVGTEAESLIGSAKAANSEANTIVMNKDEKIQNIEKIAKTEIEEKAKEVTDIKHEIKNGNPLEQYQEMLNQIKKEKGAISGIDIKKELPDPFLNKEEKLQLGIAELDKLKRKYIDIPDSRFLPKKVPNQMKGKPFKQRFVPGFNFQLLDGSRWGVDLMPYFVYKVSGRLRLGLGFDYRLVSDNKTFFSSAQVFGFRVLGDVRMYGTWYFHLEGEWLHFDRQNTSQPRFISDPTVHEWGERLNIGILRTYKVSRRFNGTFQALYYAGDWKSFPQTRNVSIRVGFEYNLGEKKKSPAMR